MPSHDELSRIGKANKKMNMKKIKCLTTGEVFDSATDAAAYFKIAITNISKAARLDKPVKNLYFKYID